MLEAALLAAAECRIDDLNLLFNYPELRKHWKLILNSVPETLHIDKYKHIIPKPTSVIQVIHINDENKPLFNDKRNVFHDSVENISQWSIERCFQIVKNTLNVYEFALPFLTFMIRHLGFNMNKNIFPDDKQGRHLINHYESILMLCSFYFILNQYCITKQNTKSYETLIDPVKFILNNPVDRFKIIMSKYLYSSYSELEDLFSGLFESYSNISYLNSLYNKQINKESFESTRMILKCKPLIEKCGVSGYFQQIYYSNANISICEKGLTDLLLSNASVPLEDTVIGYLFDTNKVISIDLFCKISKILVKHSVLTKNLADRYVSCPMRVIQFILLCIRGKESPLLYLKALEIQEYIDEIYECTPKSAIIIKHFNKDVVFRKLKSANLKIDDPNPSLNFICCPFCKKNSVLYKNRESVTSFKNWQNDIFFSIESIERQQLFIDICREFPIRMINEMIIHDIHRTLYNPYNAECFLINLINEIPTFYTFETIDAIISLHKIIQSSIRLPNDPFGSLLCLLFYILEKILTIKQTNVETMIEDLTNHIKSNIISIDEFRRLFLQLLSRVYNGYLEPPTLNFTIFIHKFNKGFIIENKDVDSQIKSIIESIHISNIINLLVRYSPKETEINSIFKCGHESELEKVKCFHLWINEFLYDNPCSILKEDNKENILNGLFLSNPSLTLIKTESAIYEKLKFLFKKILLTEDDTVIINNLIRLQVSTLLMYGFLNLAIKVIFNTISNKELTSDYMINILFYLSNNSKYVNEISSESYLLLDKIEKIILTSFPPNSLSLYLSYKCSPIYDKTVKINIKNIQSNIDNYFLTKYHCENEYLKDETILNLFLINNLNEPSGVKNLDLFKKYISKYDLLICCSADLLFMNGYISRLIINSVNINQKIKILICLSLISILSLKDLAPYTLNSIKSLLLITSVIHGYSRIINKLQDLSLNNQDASKILKCESDLPIYLIKYNSTKSLERWKLLLNTLPFNEVAPLINMIDKLYNKNQLKQKPNLFSYIEVYYLTKNLITVNDNIKVPLLTDDHIQIFLNYPRYCCDILLQVYKKEKQENIRYIYTLLLLLILKHLSAKEIKKITEIYLVDNNKIRIFMQLYRLFPKLNAQIINQIITGEKSIIDLIDYSKVWSNYWFVLKFIKSLNKNLSTFSFSLLKHIFIKEKRFPTNVYKSLVTHNGNCISLILYDNFKNLLGSDDNTYRFLDILPDNKQKLEIISLLINILTKNKDYKKKELLQYLNTSILTVKIKLYFPNFEYENEFQVTDSYRKTLFFTLDLFMDSNDNNIKILITNIIMPLKMDFFEILTEAIMLRLSEVNIQNKDSKDISVFIKSIFEKSNSNIFSIYGTTFCDFILKLYVNVLKMENNFIPFIFSIELVSREIFDITLLKKLTDQVIQNINVLLTKIDIRINCGELSVLLGEITNLILDQSYSLKFNHETIFHLLCQLLYYTFVLNKINISLMDQNFQIKNSSDKVLFDKIYLYKKKISELTLNMLAFIITNNMINNQQFFKYWYIFGDLLINSEDQKIFYELNKKNVFIGLNSSFKKYILTSIIYFRMEEVLASKYYKQVSYLNIYELICCFNIILNSASYAFLGTRLFSNLIIPILINSKKDKDYSFNLFGKHVCGILNIRYHDNEELSLIGTFFKTLLVYKKKIIHNLIPRLFALKSHHIIAEIVASESNVLRYSPISVKYSYKILSKLFDRFYYVNFDTTRMGIECEISNNCITPNYHYPLISYNLPGDIQYSEIFDVLYQKLLSKFYSFLFGEKHHLFEIKLADRKVTRNI